MNISVHEWAFCLIDDDDDDDNFLFKSQVLISLHSWAQVLY